MRHARRASVPGVPPTARENLQSALLAWFAENGRDLPWRHTRDPYAILVSEVMLQQTQVARVLERYPPWLERSPTGRAWHWNQALFDLGAQLCLARVPRCEACPLAASCPSRGQTFAPLRRQGRFEGSRRQRRAALVRELAAGPRTDDGYDRDVVDSLVADGLAVRRADGLLALPEEVTA